jgi:hypothetical protein
MTVAATGPTEVARKRTITEVGKDMLGTGVSTVGAGVEAIGDGVSKLGEASRKVPVVGSSVARLGEGIVAVGESITDLPRVARTRRGALLVRSLIVGFVLVFCWIAIIVLLQVRGTDSPDFRPHAERILTQLSQSKDKIEELYEVLAALPGGRARNVYRHMSTWGYRRHSSRSPRSTNRP